MGVSVQLFASSEVIHVSVELGSVVQQSKATQSKVNDKYGNANIQ